MEKCAVRYSGNSIPLREARDEEDLEFITCAKTQHGYASPHDNPRSPCDTSRLIYVCQAGDSHP